MMAAFGKGDFSSRDSISARVGHGVPGTWQAVQRGEAVTLSYEADLRIFNTDRTGSARFRLNGSRESPAVTRLPAFSLGAVLGPAADLSLTMGLIHRGLLQSTEARRLLRREGALSTFGFPSVYFRNTKKNQFQSKRIYVPPHRNQACSVFEGCLLHVTAWESPSSATLGPHHGYRPPLSCPLYRGPHN